MQLATALALCLFSQQPAKELRGVWLHASDGVFASQAELGKAMEALADARFNVVFPCVWDGAYTLWHSPTAKEALGSDCDPAYGERDVFSEILLEAHRVGLEVLPWFEAGFTAKGALLDKHPAWAALGKDGKPLVLAGESWVDALNPEAQQFYLGLVLELARNFDIDGIAGSERFPALPVAKSAPQVTDFLGRISGGLRPALAIVMNPHGADWSQDYASWSEKNFVHALVLPAALASAEHKEKLCVSLASGAMSKAELASARQLKLAGAVFAYSKTIPEELFEDPAIPPWRTEEGWRPKPLELRPQAGSGKWTFPDSPGPMVMTLNGGQKGEASWTARARLAGVYDVYTWIPPDQPLGETAKYQLATKRGLETMTLRIGPLASRGWRRLGAVTLPEAEEFEVARYDAIEKDGGKCSAIGPLLLVYDRSASR